MGDGIPVIMYILLLVWSGGHMRKRGSKTTTRENTPHEDEEVECFDVPWLIKPTEQSGETDDLNAVKSRRKLRKLAFLLACLLNQCINDTTNKNINNQVKSNDRR